MDEYHNNVEKILRISLFIANSYVETQNKIYLYTGFVVQLHLLERKDINSLFSLVAVV